MPQPNYEVDAYHRHPQRLISRIGVHGMREARTIAALCIQDGADLVNIVAVDAGGPWVATTFYANSLAGAQTRAAMKARREADDGRR